MCGKTVKAALNILSSILKGLRLLMCGKALPFRYDSP